MLFLATLLVAAWGCTSAPAPNQAVTAPDPGPSAAVLAGREVATEHFYQGKALALAGESDCARLEFEAALEAYRTSARPGNREDIEFAEQLWDSILHYRAVTDRPYAVSQERPPAEDTTDNLLSATATSSPEEVETVGRELAGSAELFDLPVVVNDRVLKALAFYQFRTPKAFAAALQRSGRYLPLMRRILAEENLPQDLVYVAMIESAFKAQAHSRKGAHGFWQFISETGRRYGLRQTRTLDERRDMVKSTRAAARYFRDLYEMFGDWYLAMAGYSTGEGRVLRGLQRTGARDYWELSEGNTLHQETRQYVPFVLAAALIARDPARFGFDVVPDPPIAFDIVELPRAVDLARVADATGTTVEDLRFLNNELKTRVTPREIQPYPLRVPPGTGELLVTRLASLPPAPEYRERRVTVQKGDTLAKLARRHGVTVTDLCDWNDLAKNARVKRGSTLVLQVPATKKKSTAPTQILARVRPGEAPVEGASATPGEVRALPTPSSAVPATILAEMAVRSPAPGSVELAAKPLPSEVDIPAAGYALEPPRRPAAAVNAAAPSAAAAAPAQKSEAEARRVVHTVKKGETLFSISQRYGLSIDQIRRENRMSRRAVLQAGSRLTLTLASVR